MNLTGQIRLANDLGSKVRHILESFSILELDLPCGTLPFEFKFKSSKQNSDQSDNGTSLRLVLIYNKQIRMSACI